MTKAPIACAGCAYRRPASPRLPRITVCHYMLDTGESRGCTPQQCTRWRERTTASACWDKLLAAIKTESATN